MKEKINGDRRRFLGAATMTIAGARFGAIDSRTAQSSQTKTSPPTSGAPDSSFGALKQIDAGVLNVGYADIGPTGGPPVVLLHGWPYDIHSYVDVAPVLASAGYRVIIPYLRGYGTTRFLSSDTLRNGQQAALASDVIALMDALAVDKAILAGFDWGARTANIVAALWPERCKAMVRHCEPPLERRASQESEPLQARFTLSCVFAPVERIRSGSTSPRVCALEPLPES
jgi:pimeloyl-ACP methyl ester carboxylesterase